MDVLMTITQLLSPETLQMTWVYGPLTIMFIIALGLFVHWYTVRYPKEREAQSEITRMMWEQLGLARSALETSNLVIEQNSSEMHENRVSHGRIGERLESVESLLSRHDERAEQIAKDTTCIRSSLGV